MGDVVGDAKSVSDHLGEIERRCEAMGQVVTTMVSIADRTQILSINATMEAEKAGDAGLGFRVVAREVRGGWPNGPPRARRRSSRTSIACSPPSATASAT